MCQFSNLKRRLRVKGMLYCWTWAQLTVPDPTPKEGSGEEFKPSDLFIDRLIRNPSESAVLYDEFSILKVSSPTL